MLRLLSVLATQLFGARRDLLSQDLAVFRHNRRKYPMAAFQTLLGFGTGHKPAPYEQIRGASDLGKLHAERKPQYDGVS